MFVDLVRTTTPDGHRLDGALLPPSKNSSPACDIDACLMLHGVGGNFYAGNMFENLSGRFADLGIATLRVNTRGHDSISISWGSLGPTRQGAAYEIVDQCRQDVATWVQFLQDRGYQKIALLGHSLGAIKAIYSQAHSPQPAVRAVIACSAPRLSYSAFMNSESQPKFFAAMATAKEHVEQGRPETLFQAAFPFPILITASGYIDKYGPEERYNITKFIDKVASPMLVTYGEIELDRGGVPFAGLPEALLSKRRADQSLEIVTIAGADHVYTGVYESLANAVTTWLTKQFT